VRKALLLLGALLSLMSPVWAKQHAPSETPRFVEETAKIPLLGSVRVYRPTEVSEARGVVLFVSGDGGWKLGVLAMARRLAGTALVIGLPMNEWRKIAEKHAGACWYPAGELEAMAQAVEKLYKFPRYIPPILVGYSSGATLVYGSIAQAPAGSFSGSVSLGFCPDLDVRRPFCSHEAWKPSYDGAKGISLLPPRPDLPSAPTGSPSWIALQGLVDQVCDPQQVIQFVKAIPSARAIPLPKVGHGFGNAKNWGQAFDEAVGSFLPPVSPWRLPKPAPSDAAAAAPGEVRSKLDSLDLPLVVSWPKSARQALVFVSGDGGWMELDQEVTSRLRRAGVAVIGWNSLHYFWEAKEPRRFRDDLEQVLGALPPSLPVFAGGFSFGAEVVSVSVSPASAAGGLARLAGLVLLAPGPYATFEVSPLDWLFSDSSPTRYPVGSALSRIHDRPILCLQPSGEDDSGCPAQSQPNLVRIRMPGSHHFGGNYDALTGHVLDFMKGARVSAARKKR
jgi:type IV secretory pathway VirJ component